MNLRERIQERRKYKRWYIREYHRFRDLYREAHFRADAAEREVATLRLALDLVATPEDVPLWRRIANQRHALRDANYTIGLWQKLNYYEGSAEEAERLLNEALANAAAALPGTQEGAESGNPVTDERTENG